MIKHFVLGISFILLSAFLRTSVYASEAPVPSWPFLQQIRTPHNTTLSQVMKPVVIAVVDDGVRITHRDISGFLYRNGGEIPNNDIDDDGNGFIDDIHGWDVADFNNRVSPPPGREQEFFHGTHLAGIVTRIATSVYGERAKEIIRILPVKVISDYAQESSIKSGYKGIEYAMKRGADIILCAWNGVHLTPEESQILQKARNAGILIVSSAGNFPEEKEQFPAAHPSVLAVTAVDGAAKRMATSNYGRFIDICAPGQDILSASSLSDTDYIPKSGSSQATAMVGAAAALVKALHPEFTPQMITACLKNSADIIDVVNPEYAGKLGAGILNTGAALSSTLFSDTTSTSTLTQSPQGFFRYFQPKESKVQWKIESFGDYRGVWISVSTLKGGSPEEQIKLNVESDAQKAGPFFLSDLSQPVFVPGQHPVVLLEPNRENMKGDYLLEYRIEPTDFKTLYCRGQIELRKEGILEDGSGKEAYSNKTDCKWHITAPPGKVIQFSFMEFDTEKNTDLLYFFNGRGTHEKIMAAFSGHGLPPEFTSWNNEVLVWFVTNSETQGNGWKARYRFLAPKSRPQP